MTTRGANWETRRAAIVDTSATAFAQGGYHGTGIAELCEANDLGKGALYHYIGSKEELLVAITDLVMDEVLAGVDRVAASGGSAVERLQMLGAEYLSIVARLPDHVWVLLHEFPALTGARATDFHKRRHVFESAVEDILRDGIKAGELRKTDPRLAALAWLGMHNHAYLWLKPGGRWSAKDVAAHFADIFVNGTSAARFVQAQQ
ncbi:MAG TPA: TetR/AcrR family transcriptional regulator [Mycobacteriales bacterium]|nr:TetR/AcrR family transcriptional regulator [Mycobacteriales bacterium]